ncbi:hypothetical protein Fmac_013689 [Flemingia macrophylla]|uniref:Transcription initiation factor IIF subunit alpha n=1 Tax=Flemingia macrophylla TaxID=520843 RepID=A0ABD1MUU0_9FABA
MWFNCRSLWKQLQAYDLCFTCRKTMAENKAKCFDCGATVTRLIPVLNIAFVQALAMAKITSLGGFSGLPDFSKKKTGANKWCLQKDGLQSRQVTEALGKKYKSKPWLLEDETGQSHQSHLEGAPSASYYLLLPSTDFPFHIPGLIEPGHQAIHPSHGSITCSLSTLEMLRSMERFSLMMMKAVGNDPGEREDLAPEVPAPPIDDDDEDEDNEEGGGLSKSGKVLKKLLGRTSDLNESYSEDDDVKADDEAGFPPVIASKQKDAPKEEPADNSPLKPAATETAQGTSKPSKWKRKLNEVTKASNGAPPKKEPKSSVIDENGPASKSNAPPKGVSHHHQKLPPLALDL